jgi:hypothetical protein
MLGHIVVKLLYACCSAASPQTTWKRHTDLQLEDVALRQTMMMHADPLRAPCHGGKHHARDATLLCRGMHGISWRLTVPGRHNAAHTATLCHPCLHKPGAN